MLGQELTNYPFIKWLLDHFYYLIGFALIVIAISKFTKALDDIWSFLKKPFAKKNEKAKEPKNTTQTFKDSKNFVGNLDINAKENVDIHFGDNIYQTNTKDKQKEFPHFLTNIPHNLTENVFGRDEDLEELKKLLEENSTVLVINGMGGIGKSTIAQKYVQVNQNKYDHIAYIEVPTEFESKKSESDEFTLLSTLTDTLAAGLDIQFDAKTPLENKFSTIMLMLQNIDGNNLLVIDNTSSILYKYANELPSPPNWKILTTSREQIGDFTLKDLSVLQPEPARQLFYKHYKLEKDDTILDYVFEKIGWHTLTIELLSKTCSARGIKLKELKELIDKEGLDFKIKAKVATPHGKTNPEGEYLFEHLLATFVIDLNEGCKTLLTYFSILPSVPIPYSDLIELFGINKENDTEFFENLNQLEKYGWLIKNNTENTFRCHQVIQEVTRKKLLPDENNCETLIVSLTELLRVDADKDNPINKFKWIIYGRTLLHYLNIESEKVSTLANSLGLRLKDQGYYTEAKELMTKALQSDIKNFGEDHPSTTISRSNLALRLQDLGELNKAKELMEKALQSAIKNFGDDHPSTAIIRSNLAQILQDLGDLKGAKELMTIALQSDIKNFGEDHPATARRRSNLALILQDLGDLNEAKKLMELALQSAVKNFGDDHPYTAISRSNLAQILQDLGDLTGAKELTENALKSAIKNFGEDHPSTARSRYNLGSILKDLGNLDQSKELLTKTYIYLKNKFGENHPDTKKVKGNLDNILSLIEKQKKNNKKFGQII